MSPPGLVEHFFRHEYGRLVATLSRRVGVHQTEVVEDAVQSALMTALDRWTRSGLPDNPPAWLFRVASNNLQGELRQRVRRERVLAAQGFEDVATPEPACDPAFAGEVQDDLLRMLLVCCDDAMPAEAALVLSLKTLCGFDVREIASRLFMTEANVYKRLGRARSHLRELSPDFEIDSHQVEARLPTVHQVLYSMFTEGHLSSRPETALRRDLCDEAIRLATLLAEHPASQAPETCALLALMHLHAARTNGRLDEAGDLLLLEEQDRTLWDQRQIQLGLKWLGESARGDAFSRYHAEAKIAAEHCLAPSFQETRWREIAECYSLLERLEPSPLHTLGRAVAVAEWQGPTAGLAVLQEIEPPTWLAGSYLWAAVLADLHRRGGNGLASERYRRMAIELAPTEAVKRLIERRNRI